MFHIFEIRREIGPPGAAVYSVNSGTFKSFTVLKHLAVNLKSVHCMSDLTSMLHNTVHVFTNFVPANDLGCVASAYGGGGGGRIWNGRTSLRDFRS